MKNSNLLDKNHTNDNVKCHIQPIVYKKTGKWYIEWQRVTTSGITSENEWKRVVQRVVENECQWVVISANFLFFSERILIIGTLKRTL